ncbi:MAG: penicillin-binding protein activator LpoB [Myxococcales bacterium]|nr:penicillin-binding protein activator LpoB [Myxococcales bacterium]
MRSSLILIAAFFMIFETVACSSSTPRRVTRTNPTSVEGGDLSGYWNDIDAGQVAQTLTGQLVGAGWLAEHYRASAGDERPVIKLMGVIKRTDDRNVNEQFFGKQIERFLLNSGRVRVVAAAGQEGINTRERERQSVHASDESTKTQQNELGADYTLQTIVNSQNETDGGGRSVRAYLVNMELVNVETQEKVWIGEKAIRKVIAQSRARW